MTNHSLSPSTTTILPACLIDALEQIDTGVMAIDTMHRITYVNAAICRTLALTREALVQQNLWTAFPDLVGTVFEQRYAEVVATQAPVEFDAPVPRLGVWLHVRAIPSTDGLAIYLTEISEDHHRMRLQARMLDAVGEAVIATDPTGMVTYWNAAASHLYGWSAAEALGHPIYALTVPDIAQADAVAIMETLQRGESWSGEFSVQRRDGTIFPAAVTDSPILDATGEMIGIIGVSRDLTEPKAAEQALRDRTAFLELVTESIPQYLFWKDAASVYQGCNSQFAQAAGLSSAADIIGKTDYELGWKRDKADDFRARDQRVMASGLAECHTVETRQCANGRALVLDVNKVPIRNANGDIVGVLGMYDDITERKRVEDALQTSETRLRRLYDSGLLGVIYWTMDGVITDANDKFLEMVGYTRDDLIAGHIDWVNMTPPEYRYLDERSVIELQTTGVNAHPFEKEYLCKDGTRLPILVAGAMLDDTRINGVAFVLDITERKQAEAALCASEDRYHTLFDSMTEGFALHEIITDEHGQPCDYRFLDVNPAFERLTGLQRANLLGRRVLEVLPGTESYWIDGYGRVALTGDPVHFENYSAEIGCWYEVFAYQPSANQFAVIITDITERKRAEAAMHEIDHAKDEFLAVLSHELQTPLTSMLGFADLALAQDTLEIYRKTVPIIERNAKRQARLVNELLDMSKLLQNRVECQPVAADLGHLAMTMIEQMLPGAEIGGVTLLMQPAHGALPVLVDPKRMLVCIEHLIGNSIKFTPAGGTITVTCQLQNEQALLTVTDTGRGIDPAKLAVLFTPFQQVERDEAAGGLGLGLAVVRGYVEWHGGTVSADSPGPGHGSTFTISLPLASANTCFGGGKRRFTTQKGFQS